MSELIATRARADIHLQLLGTVSALTLLVAASTAAKAEDVERPTVWIELGGQLERVDGGEAAFVPPFLLKTPRPASETVSPAAFAHPPRYSKGGEAAVTFAPRHSDWRFSASVRYGRSNGSKGDHQQSYPNTAPTQTGVAYAHPIAAQFSDMKAKYSESHAVLDFNAGKDVGLGLLGTRGDSTLNVGIRFAQFGAKSNVTFRSDPDWHIYYLSLHVGTRVLKIARGQPYHSNFGQFADTRSFHGIGPSLSWNGSAPIAGNPDATELAVDWGVNLAVLFGRQKNSGSEERAAYYHSKAAPRFGDGKRRVLYDYPTPWNRSRSVVVPNVGGFAGVSFKFPAAKVSLGYRADFFFGAMDNGLDTRKTYDRDFYGPFATISIGLGG